MAPATATGSQVVKHWHLEDNFPLRVLTPAHSDPMQSQPTHVGTLDSSPLIYKMVQVGAQGPQGPA